MSVLLLLQLLLFIYIELLLTSTFRKQIVELTLKGNK